MSGLGQEDALGIDETAEPVEVRRHRVRIDDQPLHEASEPGEGEIEPDGGVARLRLRGQACPVGYVEPDPLVTKLNALTDEARMNALSRCCASRRWTEAMAASAPFVSRAEILGLAEEAWWHLDESDWKDAFLGHPPIGGDLAALRAKFGHSADWSAEEQAGANDADDAVLEALAAQNQVYLERFGYIFIVCATGKSAAEMLELLEGRLGNSPEFEIRVAANEQAKITQLRMEKLVAPAAE